MDCLLKNKLEGIIRFTFFKKENESEMYKGKKRTEIESWIVSPRKQIKTVSYQIIAL